MPYSKKQKAAIHAKYSDEKASRIIHEGEKHKRKKRKYRKR